MSAPIDSRSLILDRVQKATARTADQDSPRIPRGYMRTGRLSGPERIRLMVERLREYDAEVLECRESDLSSWIADHLKASGKRKFLAPPGLPAEWLTGGFTWKIDRGLDHEEIEQCEGVVTACSAGIAESGTIVLHHSPSEGRRVISLLPDWHLCILFENQVVETLPEYFDRCSQPPAMATYISGPSATADIEMTRVKGVHGPRFLHVILVQDQVALNTTPGKGRFQ
jgi:L-lactate dehydrogenase complex protein LldG